MGKNCTEAHTGWMRTPAAGKKNYVDIATSSANHRGSA